MEHRHGPTQTGSAADGEGVSDFEDDVLERLQPLGQVRGKRMFGGLGLYCGDAFFAIVWRDALYFKVDAPSRADYERAGMGPFRPFADKPAMRGYYEVPPRVYDDARELKAWAERSIAVAAGRSKPARRARPASDRLRNLGATTRAWLAEVGIDSRADLERLGSVAAFRAVRKRRPEVTLELLYAFEAALLGVPRSRLPAALKGALRAAVEPKSRRS
jgi:DNA transformation protein